MMSEIVPSFGEYHQAQIIKTFRTIGRFLLSGLLEAGKSMSLRVPEIDVNAITDEEINNFVRRCETSEFENQLEYLTKQNPID